MSSDAAISARSIGKDYFLGRSGRTASIAEIVAQRVRNPLRPRAERQRFTALEDISFDIQQGEVVGVIGKNGAGKSTLLKILSRIIWPDRGLIQIHGRVGALLEVGTGFHPELTGRENVYLNGAILGMKRRTIDARFEEISAFAGIPEFLDTPVKRYSSGMRVRLAFAVAAHLDPEVLIVDEVLSVGDLEFQAKCLAKMKAIASDEGRTVLYVSHKLETVEALCPRTILLEKGHLVFDGETDEALTCYLGTIPVATPGNAVGIFDLTEVDRSGAGLEPVFSRVELRPRSGPPSDTLRMGDSMSVHIGVDGLNAIDRPNLQVRVSADGGEFLFRINSRMLLINVPSQRAPAESIVIEFPSLPLTPGDYEIGLILRNGRGDTVDRVHGAARFRVVTSDRFGTGYEFSQRDGFFSIPWTWEVRPDDGSVEST